MIQKISMLSKIKIIIISIIITVCLLELSLSMIIKFTYKPPAQETFKFIKTSSPFYNPNQYYGSYDNWPIMQYNTYLGYMPRPNTTGKGYYTNNIGMRYSKDIKVKKEAKEIRVFITGGSTAWGSGVNQEQLYSTICEKTLENKYKDKKVPIRVMSSGAFGYCSTQERIRIENMIIDYSPDIIVLFSGWNDSYCGYNGKNTLLSNDALNLVSYLNKANVPNLVNKVSPSEDIAPPEPKDYKFKIKYLFDKAIYRLKFRNRRALENKIKTIVIPKEKVLNILLENIHIICDLSKRYKFKVIYYLQPTIYLTSKDLTDFEKEIVSGGNKNFIWFPEYNAEVYRLYRTKLVNDAIAEKYLFVDADDAIKNEKQSVFLDHVHFGDRGNKLIGEH
jgi:hypothetical protein